MIIYGFFILCFASSDPQMVPALYVFGDSLVDVGNNNFLTLSIAKANHRHYGIDFPNHIPTGRFSNGKNAADFVGNSNSFQTKTLPFQMFLQSCRHLCVHVF